MALPRRALAGVGATFKDVIRIGDRLTKVTEVADIVIDEDETHPNVLVTVRETYSSARGVAVVEDRGFRYLGENGPAARRDPPSVPDRAAWSRT